MQQILQVLDVLRVVGVIEYYKLGDYFTSTLSGTSDATVYTLCSFAKSFKVTDIGKMKEETDKLIKSKVETNARMKELQVIGFILKIVYLGLMIMIKIAP